MFFHVFLAAAFAAPAADVVAKLPGWDKALPSRHYSGYLPVGAASGVKGALHYWFIEAESNPKTAPVALWLNGGPGSSSLLGLLTENGQFQTNDLSFQNVSGTPRLFYNPHAWTQAANMIWLESPKGVGFSYCDDSSACTNTDESTASDAYEALLYFFKQFPEYANNDFYITGESYAGIYIPMLMQQIDKKGGIKLKGAAIGNGCWGNSVGTCAFGTEARSILAEFYYGHGMYPISLYSQIKAACGDYSPLSAECEKLLNEAESSVGSFDVYNIYDQCGQDQWESASPVLRAAHLPNVVSTHGLEESLLSHPSLKSRKPSNAKPKPRASGSKLGGALNDYYCGASAGMARWLADANVQTALHVKPPSFQQYRKTAGDLRPLYKALISKYRMLIYSGDVDACVPYYGTEEWTRLLGLPVVSDWHPWKADSLDAKNIKAGYVVNYASNFTFLTIAGAGHLVPQHKPPQALAMIKRFFSNLPY